MRSLATLLSRDAIAEAKCGDVAVVILGENVVGALHFRRREEGREGEQWMPSILRRTIVSAARGLRTNPLLRLR